jgi:signal peptide peptidase SppA
MHYRYPHLAVRLFGAPLAIHAGKLDAIIAGVGSRFGLAVPAGAMIDEETTRRDAPPYRMAVDGVAVVPIVGSLVQRAGAMDAVSGLMSYTDVAASFERALADPAVRAIVLEIDSHGGEVAGLFGLADRIEAGRARKPIVASVNEAAFSAAYAIASATDAVILPPTAGVGSIGVVAVHIDQSAADAEDGLDYSFIYAGARKIDGNPHQPLTDAAMATLQAEIDRVHGIFAAAVARRRNLPVDAVLATEAGLYFGADAVARGLADRIGTLADAIAEAAARAARAPSLRGGLPRATGRTGASMHADTQAGAETPAPAPVIDLAAARGQGEAAAIAYAAEVAELCVLAGRPASAAAFIAKRTPVAEVRRALLSARAAEDEARVIDPHRPPASASRDHGWGDVIAKTFRTKEA